MIIKFLILFTSLLLSAPVTQDDAINVAKNLMFEHTEIEPSKLIINDVIKLGSKRTNLYIINFYLNGFAVISADDRAIPILAFSTDNVINIENIPPQFSEILDSWQEGLEFIINNNIRASNETESEWRKYLSSNLIYDRTRNIQPLITANWDQGGAWNNLCPSNTLVGCVAVSMAQVMYFWQYPLNGEGQNSYYHNDYGEIFTDFNFSFYNYQNMQDNQATNASQLLLYESGVSVNMDYGSDASGAYVVWGANSAINALVDHFQYNNDISAVYKSDYNDLQWNELLKNELHQSRPIIFRAYDSSSGGGHAWNIDGYQGEDYFHCNWGWGGNSNGYFYLNNLNASGYNFIIDQAAIINIKPVLSGCTDVNALNFDPTAQVEDGSCFWGLDSPENVVLLTEGNSISAMIGYDVIFYPEIISDDGDGELIFKIKIKNLDEPIAGFQFKINSDDILLNQFEINSVYGGAAEANDFLIEEQDNIILGFSFSGNTISEGTHDLFFISASYDPEINNGEISQIKISNSTEIVFSDFVGNDLNASFIPAKFQYGTTYSELNFDLSCGDGMCSPNEILDCFSDCNGINNDIQYVVTGNQNIQTFIPIVDNYVISDLQYATQYCYEFQSFYNNQYSDNSNINCIETDLPPQINIDINELNISLAFGEDYTDTLILINNGESTLNYNLLLDSDIQQNSTFIGEYYSNPGSSGSPNFGDLIFTREDEVIDFNWGNGSPDELIPEDDYQVRWTGNLFIESSGLYSFRSYTDDGVRLYIDDILVIDHWSSQAPTSRYGEIDLDTGNHNLAMEYYEDGGGAVASLFMTAPGASENLVFPAENGWLTFNQFQGSIFPNESKFLIYSINSGNLNIGSYSTILNIESNDPNSTIFQFPINLNVGLADCFGTIGGNAYLDECGVCSGGISGHTANSDQDCTGNCFGSVLIDSCGLCGGDDSTCSGCTDEFAINYNESALIDDASCEYLGDINDDDTINITDIVIMISMVLDSQFNELADLDENGILNIVDIVLLINIILN